MAIYAVLEDEKSLLNLYKKYNENNLEILFPIFALYYKLDNNDKAIEYLNKINKINPNFLKFFKGTINLNENNMQGYYSIGESSEVLMYFKTYYFLITTMPTLDYFVLENSKKSK